MNPPDDWLKIVSTGLTNTHTARGFSVPYHVSARKQCILCSALRHKSYLTLLYLHRFEVHSSLELSRTALLGYSLSEGLQNTVELRYNKPL